MDWVNAGLSPTFSDSFGLSPKFSNSLIFIIVEIYGLRGLGVASEEPPALLALFLFYFFYILFSL